MNALHFNVNHHLLTARSLNVLSTFLWQTMAVAGGVLLSGFLVLLAAAVFGLDTFLQRPWLSALIVGAIVVVIGFIMLQSAKKKMKSCGRGKVRSEMSKDCIKRCGPSGATKRRSKTNQCVRR